MHATPFAHRMLALLTAATLVVGTSSAVAGAEPVGGVPADTVPEGAAGPEEPAPPLRPFPDVPGVDLDALGHAGPAIDGALIERMGQPLPSAEDPYERVVEITQRLDLAPPQLESLIEADALLGRAVSSLEAEAEQAHGAAQVNARRAEVAAERVADARERLGRQVDALDRHRRDMAEVAVAAYVHPPDADVLAKVMGGAATTTDDLSAGVLFSAKADHDGVVRDSLEVSQALGYEQVRRAEDDAVGAARMAEQSAQALAAIEQRRDLFRTAFDDVRTARTLLEQQLPALQADLDRTIEEAWGSLEDLAGIDVVGAPVVVDVQGIRVHPAIAPRLQALLAAAHADGVPLGGWGHRDTEQQIALRRAHCGPTPQDIYLKPAGECSPPTARPGASMHERGLAVDFHLAGRSISTHESPGYQWLAAHAHVFGFKNLPSEPWHWSVNGQ